MSLVYVIDGYNIIKHPIIARTVKRNSSDSPQRALLTYIRSRKLTGSPKNKIVIVFDGYPSSRAGAGYESEEIIYARSVSADEKIQRLVDKASNPKSVVVVTNDRQLRYYVRGAQAAVMKVEEFFKLGRPSGEGGQRDKQGNKGSRTQDDGKLSYSEIAMINKELRRLWLKE